LGRFLKIYMFFPGKLSPARSMTGPLPRPKA
jgi:hypothetical protein